MLPSSPPTRAWKPSGSPAGSEYSINLDALDIDSRSENSTGIPQPRVDRILSDDIDGPSDFTQNMEHWLRGSMRRQGTLSRTRKQDTPLQNDRPVEQTIRQPSQQALVPPQTEDHDNEPEVLDDDDGTMSNHTPAGTPPRISISQRTPGGDDQFSSEWEPYGITSTPFPDAHKDFLQPTVEDYHSELTPAAQSLRHSVVERKSFGFPRQASVFRPSGPVPTYSQRPSPFLDQSVHGKVNPDVGREVPNVEAWQAKCRQLEQHITEIRKVLDEERRLRDEERAAHEEERVAHEADMAAADRREQSSAETTYHAQMEAETLRQECDTLKNQVLNQDDLLKRAKLDKSTASQGILDQLRDAREELRVQVASHSEIVQTLQRDLTSARSAQHAAEQEAESRRVELDNHRETHDAEMLRLQLEVQDAHDDEDTIVELEEQLRVARIENEQLKAEREEAKDEIKNLQDRLSNDRQAHSEGVSRHLTERTRAVESATGFQKQVQDLRQQLRQEQAQHEAEVAQVRADQTEGSKTTQQELDLMRNELEAKVIELNEAVLDRDDAQDSLRTAQTALEDLKLEMAAVGNVNAALDARVSDALRRREKYWRDKLLEADRERQVMAKALLHQWGREEAGIQDPQLYAYKYLHKSSEARRQSPTEV